MSHRDIATVHSREAMKNDSLLCLPVEIRIKILRFLLTNPDTVIRFGAPRNRYVNPESEL